MASLSVLAGLASLAGLSLFLARALKRSSSLMPLLAGAAAMLYFTAAGVAGFLRPAGYVWYGLCAAALVWVLYKEKRAVARLFTPGFVFFLVGGLFFVVYYVVARPLLTQWDEFTFWGTAAKAVGESDLLYTVADSSLIARTYPPGFVLFGYMMQFWGGFTEHGFIAACAIFYLPAFSAASALWGKVRTGATVFLAGLFLLPLLFETGGPYGEMAYAYLGCMVDLPMAIYFGGALCFYFAGGQRDSRLLLPLAVVLAALVNLKDMGLALALVAWAVVLLDLVFCERDRLRFLRLGRWRGLLCWAGAALALLVGTYLLWALHLRFGVGVDRFNLAPGGGQLGQAEMLLAGFKALLGLQPNEQFSLVLPLMLKALVARRVSLMGSGLVMLVFILALSALVWVLSPTRRQRRRVLVYTLAMAAGFAAFYLFNIFVYAFIFSPIEAGILKDYARYIGPYWAGWLMGALALLANAATNEKSIFIRLRAARALSLAVALAFAAVLAMRGNHQANFLRISPSLYGERISVRQVADEARLQGLAKGDKVYVVAQYDDGTRFYILGLELEAVRVPVFFGPDESAPPDEAGRPRYIGNAAGVLTNPAALAGAASEGTMVACTPKELAEYLRQSECTHVLVDTVDTYFLEAFGPMFSDGLADWEEEVPLGARQRYYQVQWENDGSCRLVARDGGGAG